MKAVVYQGPYQVAVEDVPQPRIEAPGDALVRITTTNICGSDLHMYEGRMSAGKGKIPGPQKLRDLIIAGRAHPSWLVSHEVPLTGAPAAYEKFDKRADGYTKVLLHPAA